MAAWSGRPDWADRPAVGAAGAPHWAAQCRLNCLWRPESRRLRPAWPVQPARAAVTAGFDSGEGFRAASATGLGVPPALGRRLGNWRARSAHKPHLRRRSRRKSPAPAAEQAAAAYRIRPFQSRSRRRRPASGTRPGQRSAAGFAAPGVDHQPLTARRAGVDIGQIDGVVSTQRPDQSKALGPQPFGDFAGRCCADRRKPLRPGPRSNGTANAANAASAARTAIGRDLPYEPTMINSSWIDPLSQSFARIAARSRRRRLRPGAKTKKPGDFALLGLERRHEAQQGSSWSGLCRARGSGWSSHGIARRQRARPQRLRSARRRRPRWLRSARPAAARARIGKPVAQTPGCGVGAPASRSHRPPSDRPPSARRGSAPWTACDRRACAISKVGRPRRIEEDDRLASERAVLGRAERKRVDSGAPGHVGGRDAGGDERIGEARAVHMQPDARRVSDRRRAPRLLDAVDRSGLGRLRERQRARLRGLDEPARKPIKRLRAAPLA